VKYAYKNGLCETLTELLINQIGTGCTFDMAHSGLASVDDVPVFVTRSFLGPREHLIHGSFLIDIPQGSRTRSLSQFCEKRFVPSYSVFPNTHGSRGARWLPTPPSIRSLSARGTSDPRETTAGQAQRRETLFPGK